MDPHSPAGDLALACRNQWVEGQVLSRSLGGSSTILPLQKRKQRLRESRELAEGHVA